MKKTFRWGLFLLKFAVLLAFSACNMATDETPPGDITNCSYEEKGEAVSFNWTNPSDSDYSGVEIRVASLDENESTFKTYFVSSKFSSFTVEELTNNVTYSFTFIAVDSSKNRSEGISINAVPYGLGAVRKPSLTILQGEAILRWINPKDTKFEGIHIQVINNSIEPSEEQPAENSRSAAPEEITGFEQQASDKTEISETTESEQAAEPLAEIAAFEETESVQEIEPVQTEEINSAENTEDEVLQSIIMPEEQNEDAELTEEEISSLLTKTVSTEETEEVPEERVRHFYTDGFNGEYYITDLTPGTTYTFILTAYDVDNKCSEEVILEGTIPEETDSLSYELTADKTAYRVQSFNGDESARHITTPEQENGTGVENPITVVVPETHNGKPVVEIGDSAFKNCHNVTEIKLPSSIKTIGINAFAYCTGLNGISVPQNTVEIKDGAFWNCTNLKWLAIPKSVSKIGLGAILGDSKLTTVFYTGCEEEWTNLLKNVGSGNALLKGSSIILKKSADIRFNYDGVTPIELISPDPVTNAFAQEGNSFVSLAWINPQDNDFAGVRIDAVNEENSAVQTYYVPSDKDFFIVTELENETPYTFILSSFDGLKNYSDPVTIQKVIPQLVEYTSPEGFYYYLNENGVTCSLSGVTDKTDIVQIPSVINNYPVTKISEKAFAGNEILQIAVIPSTITEIDETSFEDCINLKNVYYSSSFDQWEMIEGIEYIEAAVRYNFEIVQDDEIPPEEVKVNNIRHGDQKIVFSFDLPEDSDFYKLVFETESEDVNVTSVREDCFAVLNLINGVSYRFTVKTQDIYGNISEGIEVEAEAGELPFSGVTDDGFVYELCLNESELSGTSYKILKYEMSEEEKNKESVSVTIPDVIHDVFVTDIASECFADVSNITEIVIPASVINIEEHTLELPSLARIIVSEENKVYYTNANGNILYCKTGNQKNLIKVLSSVSGVLDFTGTQISEISSYCFAGCSKITKVILPQRLLRIYSNSFSNCKILNTVIMPYTVRKIGKDIFENCPKFTVCYYTGTEKQLAKISIDEEYKTKLLSVIKLYGNLK